MAERSASGGDSLGGGDDLEMGVMPPNPLETFLATIEDIRLRLEKINKSVGDIEGLHRQVLNAVSVEEATRLGRLIDELVSRTNAEAQHIRRALKSLASETEEHRLARTITPSDLRMRTTQQTRYAKKFMATMSKFQSMQTTYQAKYRQQLERQYLIVKPSATREELDQLTHSADPTALLNQQVCPGPATFPPPSNAVSVRRFSPLPTDHRRKRPWPRCASGTTISWPLKRASRSCIKCLSTWPLSWSNRESSLTRLKIT